MITATKLNTHGDICKFSLAVIDKSNFIWNNGYNQLHNNMLDKELLRFQIDPG